MMRPLILVCWGQILAQAKGPLLMRLDRDDRIRVFLALGAILALGFVMVLLGWWGARWTRRYVNRPSRRQRESEFPRLSPEDWASKKLHDAGIDEPREPSDQ